MKIKYLSILIAGLMLVGIPGMVHSSQITNTFFGTVASGPFTGYEGTGSFTYDNSFLNIGDEDLSPSDGLIMVSLLFDGQTFNQTNDMGYSTFPRLDFNSFTPAFLDFVVADSQSGVAFNNPNLIAVYLGNLTPLANGTIEFEVEIFAEPVPEPATMLLLGTGLVGVAGAARKRKKNQA